MTGGLVQEIGADLAALERQDVLWTDTGFTARVHTLDVLRRQVIERLENIMYVHGYDAELAGLCQRAGELRQRLEAEQHAFFQHVRAQIMAGRNTRAVVLDLCATHVGDATRIPGRDIGEEEYLDVFINGVLGIGQAPEETVGLASGMIGYFPTPARVVFALVDHLGLGRDDVFFDLGAGLGRVSLLAALLSSASTRGIEIEPAYCQYAQQRACALELDRVRFVNCDARTADYAEGSVFFLYTPFTGRMLQEVLDRLHSEAQTRSITIAAYGLCVEHVARQSWLRLTVRQAFEHDTLALFRSHARGAASQPCSM